jgi:hypothetical protein
VKNFTSAEGPRSKARKSRPEWDLCSQRAIHRLDRELGRLVGVGVGRSLRPVCTRSRIPRPLAIATPSGAGEVGIPFLGEGADRFHEVVGDQERRVPLRHVVEGLVDGPSIIGLEDSLDALGDQR